MTYQETFRKARAEIILVNVLFVVSIIAGMSSSMEQVTKIMQELADFTEPLVEVEAFMLVDFIFMNNAVKTLLIILLGVLLGIPSLLFVFFNGYIIGTKVTVF